MTTTAGAISQWLTSKGIRWTYEISSGLEKVQFEVEKTAKRNVTKRIYFTIDVHTSQIQLNRVFVYCGGLTNETWNPPELADPGFFDAVEAKLKGWRATNNL